jgi:hypothetical protein
MYREPEPRHPTQMAVVLSVHSPGIELGLSRILQSLTHCNGSDAARDASVKNHYCFRAITQSLITNRAFTDKVLENQASK